MRHRRTMTPPEAIPAYVTSITRGRSGRGVPVVRIHLRLHGGQKIRHTIASDTEYGRQLLRHIKSVTRGGRVRVVMRPTPGFEFMRVTGFYPPEPRDVSIARRVARALRHVSYHIDEYVQLRQQRGGSR